MPFSFHPTPFTGTNQSAYADDWLTSVEMDQVLLAKAICKYVWSPCVWAERSRETGALDPVFESGRAKKNFYGACYCVLDYDSGLTLSDAVSLFRDYTHIIATTRSHQKIKNGATCDRFRVVLMFDTFIEDLKQYEHNLRYYTAKFKSDPMTVDGGRMFYPCVDVISIEPGGTLEVLDVPVPPKRYEPKIDKVTGEVIHRPTKAMREFEEHGAYVESTRNHTILTVARARAFRDFTLEDTLEYCISKTSLDAREVEATVRSAYKWAELKQKEDAEEELAP